MILEKILLFKNLLLQTWVLDPMVTLEKILLRTYNKQDFWSSCDTREDIILLLQLQIGVLDQYVDTRGDIVKSLLQQTGFFYPVVILEKILRTCCNWSIWSNIDTREDNVKNLLQQTGFFDPIVTLEKTLFYYYNCKLGFLINMLTLEKILLRTYLLT